MNTKGERREAARNKKRNGMKVSGRSVFVINAAEAKRIQKKIGKGK